jgi:hypothetical protein|uniref:Uncharacterized protein n=1 Tax=Chlorella vulgaris TaxID=3077 RepID=V9H0R6_CHLVU|nr:hypothetical protein ChvulCp014 [Chlorella vulgaris]pir/T07202/ hypothetical protein 48a - Chlorella vulgaris chloroplast [Chlorella vulgaris]QSV10821.1 hypothetical protein [Chlorella vulgaris]BAA57849.1 unnamed protein product [Chlorella vulgaris]
MFSKKKFSKYFILLNYLDTSSKKMMRFCLQFGFILRLIAKNFFNKTNK